MLYMALAYLLGGLILGLAIAFALGWWWSRPAPARREIRLRILNNRTGDLLLDMTGPQLAAFLERYTPHRVSLCTTPDLYVYAELIVDSSLN